MGTGFTTGDLTLATTFFLKDFFCADCLDLSGLPGARLFLDAVFTTFFTTFFPALFPNLFAGAFLDDPLLPARLATLRLPRADNFVAMRISNPLCENQDNTNYGN